MESIPINHKFRARECIEMALVHVYEAAALATPQSADMACLSKIAAGLSDYDTWLAALEAGKDWQHTEAT
jgi:hypothetical protein